MATTDPSMLARLAVLVAWDLDGGKPDGRYVVREHEERVEGGVVDAPVVGQVHRLVVVADVLVTAGLGGGDLEVEDAPDRQPVGVEDPRARSKARSTLMAPPGPNWSALTWI